ncbi:Vesicular-fusion protein SEC17, partial [Intoshia linei]
MSEEEKADELVHLGEKKAKSISGFFGSIFKSSGNVNLEDACDILIKAANLYKMAKCWDKAATTYEKIGTLREKLDVKHEAATAYVDAANAYKKVNVNGAILSYNKAIEIYTHMGRFVVAARYHCSIADIYETELADIDKALFHYEKAGDYYRGEESNSAANKCLLKVAQFCSEKQQYKKAIELYED